MLLKLNYNKMKKIIGLLSLSLLVLSCNKTEKEEVNVNTAPVAIRIDAIHTTGEIVSSEVILVR